MDPYKFLQITQNPNGTLTRYADIPIVPPTGEHPPPDCSAPALSKDVPLNTTRGTWLRIFLSKPLPADAKLPVILYFHGGGFILFSAASGIFPAVSAERAAKIPAIIISVDYRLAPEHRLPAAYDDATDALLLIRDQARGINPDPWLEQHADFSRVFIMGGSAGANIAYHLGLRSLDLDLGPVKVSGMILNQPFFGGEERTESEASSTQDRILPLQATDLMWELSLPLGANRDHEYCNPMNSILKRPTELPKCLVKGFIGDPLYDRQQEFVRMMEEQGASVVAAMDDQGYHGIEMMDLDKAESLNDECRKFIYGSEAVLAEID